MWVGLWEGIVSVGKQRIARAPRALLALPAPAQGSPALPTAPVPCQPLPQWWHSKVGLQLPEPCLAMGPYKPAPHPGVSLMLPAHRELPPAPWRYRSAFPLQLGYPLHLADTVRAHTQLGSSNKRQVATKPEEAGWQELAGTRSCIVAINMEIKCQKLIWTQPSIFAINTSL